MNACKKPCLVHFSHHPCSPHSWRQAVMVPTPLSCVSSLAWHLGPGGMRAFISPPNRGVVLSQVVAAGVRARGLLLALTTVLGDAMDYSKICFVIMPFGKKKVGRKNVDFDKIHREIFAPAIASVRLPEGGSLEPRRTDTDFFTGDIKLERFQFLEYSRFALADISGLNFNVAYELGA